VKSALPIAAVVLAILAIWCVAAALLNAPLQRDLFANAGRTDYSVQELVAASLNMERPKLPAPHQVGAELYKLVLATPPTSKRSLVYHGVITLEETLIGFAIGSALGIGLAVLIVSMRWLERSAMPWIVASQTVPIIALAPMIVVILNQFNITGVAPKAVIAAYLSFFPVTVGMVKGFRSPDPLQLDLMRVVGGARRRNRRRRADRPPAHGGPVMTPRGFRELLPPLAFGLAVLAIWEAGVRLLQVPPIILPPPSAIAMRLVTSIPTLAADFRQTIQGVLAGYVIGSLAGFLVAILIDRSPFLQRGLLPIGNLVSALPIVGVAPIMVMWFGFDWQSKAAVVVVMTFFPMLVNTVAGLASAGAMERDLMKTYGANYWQTLLALRLPVAMPFIFNALKINTTLAMIGAIVAEFFGTPIVGMGFRISTEVGRLQIDMVWATIVVAAVVGSLFYALVAGIERRVTFWHASYRAKEA